MSQSQVAEQMARINNEVMENLMVKFLAAPNFLSKCSRWRFEPPVFVLNHICLTLNGVDRFLFADVDGGIQSQKVERSRRRIILENELQR